MYFGGLRRRVSTYSAISVSPIWKAESSRRLSRKSRNRLVAAESLSPVVSSIGDPQSQIQASPHVSPHQDRARQQAAHSLEMRPRSTKNFTGSPLDPPVVNGTSPLSESGTVSMSLP